MNKQDLLTVEFLNEILEYNPGTGILIWKKTLSIRAPAGTIAGAKMSIGYLQLGINGYDYYAHRLVWFMTHGDWPKQIDHINGKRDDNRIVNLRSVNNGANSMNKHRVRSDNKSGHSGVLFDKERNKWRVYVGKKMFGRFDKKSDAVSFRKQKLVEIYGDEFSHKP